MDNNYIEKLMLDSYDALPDAVKESSRKMLIDNLNVRGLRPTSDVLRAFHAGLLLGCGASREVSASVSGATLSLCREIKRNKAKILSANNLEQL